MPNSIASIVKTINDSELARVRLSLKNGESVHLDCIFKEAEAPNFFLMFPPNTIPEHIDVKYNSPVSIHTEENSITLSARIEAIRGDRTLEMVANDTIDPASLREYFRVIYKAPIVASFDAGGSESRPRSWQVEGTTIDLSGTGLLCVFPKELESKTKVFLQFDLPGLEQTIHCMAHVVRTRRLRKERFQVALHFEHISRKNRDAIITACLQEQRKQLRERIQTM